MCQKAIGEYIALFPLKQKYNWTHIYGNVSCSCLQIHHSKINFGNGEFSSIFLKNIKLNLVFFGIILQKED
jgi:hypothetical protein